MNGDREELEALRRLSQLEAKASGQALPVSTIEQSSVGVDPLAESAGGRFALGAAGSPSGRLLLGMTTALSGPAQLGANIGDKIAEQFGFKPIVGKAINEHLAKIEDFKQRGMKFTGNEGFDWAGLAGSGIIGGAAVKNIPAAASYLGKVIQGIGIGAGAGAVTPITSGGENFFTEKGTQIGGGAAVGGIIPAIAPVVQKVGGLLYNLAEPAFNAAAIKGRAFLEAAGDKADEIIALLRSNKQIVPGSAPTAGEAAVPAGRAEFAALQKSAANVKPSEYLARSDAQNAARIATLKTVGQDEAALQAAGTARSAAADPLYEAARAQSVKSDGFLKTLLIRPSMDKALARAEELAKEQAQRFMVGKDQPAREVVSTILNASGKPAFSTTIPATAADYPVSSLHNIKMALDDMVKNPERFSIGASEVNAINNTRKAFLSWLENRVPKYKAARLTYAQKSMPMNQMEIGQYLEGKLVPALSEEAKQKATTYAGALQDAPRTIKRATGAPRFEKLTEVLTPDQMAVVNSVRDDLARGARFESMAQKGGKAAPNAIELASASMETAAGGKLPNLLHRGAMITNAIIARMEGKINKRLAAEISMEMLNPPNVADSLAKAQSRAVNNKMWAAAIERSKLPFEVAGAQATARD